METPFEIGGTVQTLTDHLAEWGLSVLGALAVFILGAWIAKRVRAGMRRSLTRAEVDAMLVPFTAALVYWVLMAFVVIAVLGIFGIPTASLAVLLGAAGLAIGLALQGTLSNFASGVMILLFRPFAVGDLVEVSDVFGTVKEIGIFSTIVFTRDNVKVIVPNSKIYGETLRNFSANETRRIDLVMGVSYDDDLQVAEDAIHRVLASEERVLDEPAPTVAVDELGDSSVDFVVRPWCRTPDYWSLRRALTRRLKEELEAAGCSIPYPQRDVHLHRET
jgi:small conductance mechanosensitive channel